MKHTPGPWQQVWQFIVAPDPEGIHPDIYIAEIAEEDSEGRVASPEQQEANGSLIVAAPALLAACQMVIARYWEHGDLAEAVSACHAATAIAECSAPPTAGLIPNNQHILERNHPMNVYDNYEINPCKRYEEPDSPGKFYFEVCEPDEADVWTVCGHVNGKGVQAIGDFPNRQIAEEVVFGITGLKFTGSYKSDAHLRVMHAGQKLLEALHYLLSQTVDMDLKHGIALTEDEVDARRKALSAIAEATGRAA
jgi:hypothetical protein